MKINYDILTAQLLPVRLRRIKLFSVLQALIRSIGNRNEKMLADHHNKRIDASADGSIQWIERLIALRTNTSVEIREGDHLPYDFIVSVDANDLDKRNEIAATVNRYKVAGKAWRFALSGITKTAEWSNYICQVKEQTTLYINCRKVERTGDWGFGVEVYIVNNRVAKTNLTVKVRWGTTLYIDELTIPAGGMQATVFNWRQYPAQSLIVENVSPEFYQDEVYEPGVETD